MLTKIFLTASMLAFSGLAMSASQTWNFHGQNLQNNALALSVGGVNLEVTSWSSTGGYAPGSPDIDPLIERSTLLSYSNGLGSSNKDEGTNRPHYAFDSYSRNKRGLDYDMALLEFDVAVQLKDIDFGWTGSDSDISVLTYTGNNDLGSNPFGRFDKWSDLLSDGWSHNGNYADASINHNTAISGSTESKYWLIGAYNPIFGNNFSYGNDSFLLAGITTHKSKGPDPQPGTIPEPATALLMFAGLVAIRKRKNILN